MTNRAVGLWMLPAHVGASRNLLAALQREFARLRALDHPHIARLLELGCNGQQYYVTGERLDGEPLRDVLTHLAPERLDVGEADDIVRAIGSALVYAHEQGVAHGDVRAENVLVTMDRRFVLTSFLARRVAKMTARAPRPSDDLRGLARLAAELYIASTSPQALRGAVHGDVPAARLNAIRAVLDPAGRRIGSVADFLSAAGLPSATPAATLRRAEQPQRTRSLWRFVLPVATALVLGTLIAWYDGSWGVSAEELKDRGLDALRAVATRVAPQPETAAPASAAPVSAATSEPRAPATPEPRAAAVSDAAEAASEPEPAGLPPPVARPEAPPHEALPPDPQPATTAAEAAPAVLTRVATHTAQRDPAVVSLGVPRIAAREDHSVVAIDIVRSGDTAAEASVIWWTTPDTAHEEDDYASVGKRVATFAPGATVERVLIPIVNDGVREAEEAFTVHLSRPRGGVAGSVTATRVTLHDDD
jgi:hypothetical protein